MPVPPSTLSTLLSSRRPRARAARFLRGLAAIRASYRATAVAVGASLAVAVGGIWLAGQGTSAAAQAQHGEPVEHQWAGPCGDEQTAQDVPGLPSDIPNIGAHVQDTIRAVSTTTAQAIGTAAAAQASQTTTGSSVASGGSASVSSSLSGAAGGASATTMRLCGPLDPQLARALEVMLAGRGFSATLSGLPDGCADLTVSPQGPAGQSSGRQSSTTSVTAGSGASARRYTVQITSEGGQTRVSLDSSN
jgi:hypothetical protein